MGISLSTVLRKINNNRIIGILEYFARENYVIFVETSLITGYDVYLYNNDRVICLCNFYPTGITKSNLTTVKIIPRSTGWAQLYIYHNVEISVDNILYFFNTPIGEIAKKYYMPSGSTIEQIEARFSTWKIKPSLIYDKIGREYPFYFSQIVSVDPSMIDRTKMARTKFIKLL